MLRLCAAAGMCLTWMVAAQPTVPAGQSVEDHTVNLLMFLSAIVGTAWFVWMLASVKGKQDTDVQKINDRLDEIQKDLSGLRCVRENKCNVGGKP